MLRSALHNAEERWFDTIAARCGLAVSARIVALIGEDTDPAGAGRWRDPDEDLPEEFEARRAEHYASLRKPLDPAQYSATRSAVRPYFTDCSRCTIGT